MDKHNTNLEFALNLADINKDLVVITTPSPLKADGFRKDSQKFVIVNSKLPRAERSLAVQGVVGMFAESRFPTLNNPQLEAR